MGVKTGKALVLSLLMILVCSTSPLFAQDQSTFEPSSLDGLYSKLPPVPDSPGDQKVDFPLFSQVVAEDNPEDDGLAIRVRWLIVESSAARLFSEDQCPEFGQFGSWEVKKDENSVPICEEGSKKQTDVEDYSDYSAVFSGGKSLSVVILRAEANGPKPIGPFKIIDQVAAGESLEKIEVRFTEGSRQVYLPNEKIRYETPGTRKVKNQYWQNYLDSAIEQGKEYLYRVVVTDGKQAAYLYQSTAEPAGDNKTVHTLGVDFGPTSAELNALPTDKNEFESLKEKYSVDIEPPKRINAMDNPSDSGDAVLIEWLTSQQDMDVAERTRQEKMDTANPVEGYTIFRAEIFNDQQSDFFEIGRVGAGLSRIEREDQKFKDVKLKRFIDIDALQKKWNAEKCEWYKPTYSYIVAARSNGGFAFSSPSGKSSSKTQWFDRTRKTFLALAVIISVAILWFIQSIRSGKKLFVRKIAGLDAIDEAIGRATEMGRPILFIPGIQDMNDVQTVSGVIILGRIAKTIAEYDTKLMVPTARSLVMTTARETVKEAYLSAGRPDAYNDDMITYLTDEQFGYVAGVNGIMVREKPATCFYMGTFFAESLILAETGNYIGAIQIAGTAMPSQLPFFIAACDYTLIGEELFAASAYLSHDPKQLGSLKGQDLGKVIAMLAILTGVVLATIAELSGAPTMVKIFEFVRNLFQVA